MRKERPYEPDWSLQLLRTLGIALFLLLLWWILAFTLLGEEGLSAEAPLLTLDLRWSLFRLIGFPSNWLIGQMSWLQGESVAFPLIALNMILHATWLDWAVRWMRARG